MQGLQKKCIQLILANDTQNFVWACIIMEQIVICLFVNGKEIHKFKAKDSEIVATPLCLGNISKDCSVDNMKKAGLNGYVYDFIVDYDAIAVDDILDIHNYFMKKNDIV